MSKPIEIEVFADYVCPWCYLGNAVVEKLRQQTPIKLKRTPFPLHPTTPQQGLLLTELLRGVDLDSIHSRLYALMDELGLPYGKRDRTFNSRLAQELGMWADTQPDGDAFHGLMYRRYFVRNENIAETPVLLSVVDEAGLEVDAARQVLRDRSFREQVDEAWLRARGFQISGVPTFVAGGYQVSGFQPLVEMQRFVDFVQQKTAGAGTN